MIYEFEVRPAVFRIVLVILLIGLVAFAFWSFYRFAGTATDENLFVTAPSVLYLRSEVPATSVRITEAYGEDATVVGSPDTVRKGDLLVSFGRRRLSGITDLSRTLQTTTPESLLFIAVFRPSQNKYLGYRLTAAQLARLDLREIPQAVAVIAVEAGGASDRAGMQVGDLIFRMNGHSFGNAAEADRIMRRGASGSTIQYDVIRADRTIALAVTLARFGIPLTNLLYLLVGCIFLACGVFVALQAIRFKTARLLGLWFVTLGFFIAVASLRRDVDQTVFSITRDVLVVLSGYLAIVLGIHVHLHFPRERKLPQRALWILGFGYLCAILPPVLLLSGNTVPAMVVIILLALSAVLLYVVTRGQRTGDEKRILFVTRMSAVAAIGGAIGTLAVVSLLGRGGLTGIAILFLLVFPATYLYVIGRYHLFDVDLRVRRNVQYTVLSWMWGVSVLALLVNLFLYLPTLPVNIPAMYFTGTAIEIGGGQATAEDQALGIRLFLMIAAVGIWYVLWRLRRGGQSLIDRKYYQTRFDYRRAAAEMTDVLVRQLSVKDLSRAAVDRVADLLKLKRVGLFVFQEGEICCCCEATGIDLRSWEDVCPKIDRGFVRAVGAFKGLFRAEYMPDQWKGIVRAGEFPYLVPIRSKDALIGVLLLGEKLSETALNSDDQAFIDATARQMAVSIENTFLYEQVAEKERLRHELDIARRIQLSSLPAKTPDVPGLDISGHSFPASEVGGDFFDYLDGFERGITVIVGDVSGKGTSAALYMSKVQGILKSLHSFGLAPTELLSRANSLLRGDLEKSAFVTALAARFRKGDSTVTVVRAGHLPLYLYRAETGAVETVLPKGMGLGLKDSPHFSEQLEEVRIHFTTGDVLLFVTDGVTEARNHDGEEFGEVKVIAALSGCASESAQAIRDHLFRAVQSFSEGTLQHDDQTIVVVRAF